MLLVGWLSLLVLMSVWFWLFWLVWLMLSSIFCVKVVWCVLLFFVLGFVLLLWRWSGCVWRFLGWFWCDWYVVWCCSFVCFVGFVWGLVWCYRWCSCWCLVGLFLLGVVWGCGCFCWVYYLLWWDGYCWFLLKRLCYLGWFSLLCNLCLIFV